MTMPGKIRVGLLAVDPWEERALNFRPFNYGAYRIEAALRADCCADDVRLIEGRPGEVDELVERTEEFAPDIVGLSSYLWSLPTLFAAAKRLKQSRPDRTIIMGGPSARAEMMALPPFADAPEWVDALVVEESERAICEIVRAGGAKSRLGSVAGLLIPDGGAWRATARASECNLNHLASPFQLGIAPRDVTGHIERFKGCPLNCSFCQWGEPGEARWVLSREFLIEEFRAYRRCGARSGLIVDAGLNLGTTAFANLVAAEQETGFLRDTCLYCELYPRFLSPEHLDFLSSVSAHVGIGLQSYNPDVLKMVERPAAVDDFDGVVSRVAKVADVTVEMILGLPGDTPDSFRSSFERARRLGCGTRVYHCLVLPDALMRRGDRRLQMVFDPITLEMQSCLGWSADDLRRECDFLCERLAIEGGGLHGHGWWHFESPAQRSAAEIQSSDKLNSEASELIENATQSSWTLKAATLDDGKLHLHCATTHGDLTVAAWWTEGIEPAYRIIGDIAVGYRIPQGRPIAPEELRCFEAMIPALAETARKELMQARGASQESR